MTPVITKEMLKQAIEESHNECYSNDTCYHAKAFNELGKERFLGEHLLGIIQADMEATKRDHGSVEGLFFHGVHVGYRLHQLLFEKETKNAN